MGDFKKKDCPKVVETLLDTFMAQRKGDETLSECVARLNNGPQPVEVAV